MSRSSVRRTGGRQIRRKPQRSNTPLIIGGSVILVVILVAAGIALSRGTSSSPGQQFPAMVSSPHIADLTSPHEPYNSNPPTSGQHVPNTAPPGVATQPFPDELTVHNLEHGFVIIHYRQDLDQATVGQLTSLTRELQQQNLCILMEPRAVDKIDVPIAMTSWTWLLKLDSYDPDAIRTFFRARVGHGPEELCKPL